MTEAQNASGNNKLKFILIGVAVAIAVAAAIYYFRGGFGSQSANVAGKDKVDPSVTALLTPGPLPDIFIGKADAPNTIVEYASMTCPHCAQFQVEVMPQLKTKYIDTGKVRYVLREFPLDNLAVAAFMLARCAGDDKYYPMVDALFATQATWAVPGADAKDRLLQIARQAGISKEEFDKCLANKELFGKIVEVRSRGNDEFQIDSTPTFFVNGKRMTGDHQIKDFDIALGEAPAEEKTDAKPDADASKTTTPAPPPGQ